jgi:iron complex outermembrane receptor protein
MSCKNKILLGVASVVAFAHAAPGLAQTPEGEKDPQQARADVSSNPSDIVVTARRIEERLQDVPISIAVFNQQQLQNRNVTNAADLATYAPSLQADTRFGANNATFAIRGFRQDLRTSASVGVYFADVIAQRGGNGGVQAGDGAGPGSFFDLQNVQVLKGPQGTLFGRNTTGGAVLLVPKKPTGRFEGYVEGTLGNYNNRRLQSVVNIPLSDIARLRVGFDLNKRDGYLKSISGIGPQDFNDVDYIATRASLVVDLTPTLENYTILSFSQTRENGTIAKLIACGTNTASVFVILCQQQMAREAGKGFYTVENGVPDARNEGSQWQLINTTTWNATDNLRVKNIASYGELTSEVASSLQGASYLIPNQIVTPAKTYDTSAIAGNVLTYNASLAIPGGKTASQKNFVEELQVQGNIGGDKLIWQAGVYYEESRPTGEATGTNNTNFIVCTNVAALQCNDVLSVPSLLNRPVGNVAFNVVFTSFRNTGIYAQGTYKLLDKLKLTAGIRYTWDKTWGGGKVVNYRFVGTPPVTPVAACSIAGPDAATDAALLANGCVVSGETKSDAPTWVLGLDYSPIENILLYAKYSRGYRQGAYSANAPIGYQTFEPEKIDSYEAGLKSSFNGAVRGTFNLAGFYNDLSNQQLITAFASTTNAVSSTVVAVNVGKSRVYGLEADAAITPFTGFTLEASYAYLNTRIQEVAPLPATYGRYNIIRSLAVPGARFPVTPEHKVSVIGTYQLPLDTSVGNVALSVSYNYQSDYDYTTGIYGLIPSVHLWGANLNWTSVMGSAVDVSAFATNLAGKEYYISANDNISAAGHASALLGEPRIYGVRVRYNFGK